jgi:hypothetical protein
MDDRHSQSLIDGGIDIAAPAHRVDRLQSFEASDQRSGAQRTTRDRHEAGGRSTVASDRHLLTKRHPVEHVVAVLTQVTQRRFAHEGDGISGETADAAHVRNRVDCIAT